MTQPAARLPSAAAPATARLLRVTATGERLGDRLAGLGVASARLRRLAIPAALGALRPGWQPADPVSPTGPAWEQLADACARVEERHAELPEDRERARRLPAPRLPSGASNPAAPASATTRAVGSGAPSNLAALAGRGGRTLLDSLAGVAMAGGDRRTPLDNLTNGAEIATRPAADAPTADRPRGGRAVAPAPMDPSAGVPREAAVVTRAVDSTPGWAASAEADTVSRGAVRPPAPAAGVASPGGTSAWHTTADAFPAVAEVTAGTDADPVPATVGRQAGALGELLRRWDPPADEESARAPTPVGATGAARPTTTLVESPRDTPPESERAGTSARPWPAPAAPTSTDPSLAAHLRSDTSWAALDVELLLDRVEWAVDELLRREAEAHGLDSSGLGQP